MNLPAWSESDDTVSPEGTLGDFRILRQVGRGGMGIVYEAEQLSLRRRVALKTLPFAGLLDSRMLQRFQNEARAAASLEHGNIVPVYAVGVDRGVHYYAMRLINGPNLAELIDQMRSRIGADSSLPHAAATRTITRWSDALAAPEGIDGRSAGILHLHQAQQPPAATSQRVADVKTDAVYAQLEPFTAKTPLDPRYIQSAVQLVITTAEALDYAHERGVVHRDIKPSNLMLESNGVLWITDFGLARIETSPTLSMTGDVLGTLRYMSPEQAHGKRGVVDHRSDIYSLGVTLYELLTLRPIFPDTPNELVLARIATEDPTRPRSLNPSIPFNLETIVLKAMSKEPADRYATAHEFAEDLRCFRDQRPIRATRPKLADRAARLLRRHPAALVFGAIVVVLLAALGVVQTIESHERGKLIAKLNDAAAKQELLNKHLLDDLYVSEIGMAAEAIEQDNPLVALNILNRQRESPDGIDRRGFAWKWLFRKTGATASTSRVLTSPLRRIRISPDGRVAAIAAENGNLLLFDTTSWTQKRTIATGKGEVRDVVFFDGGRRLASAICDGSVCISDVETGRQIQRIDAYRDCCASLAVAPDNSKLITAGTDTDGSACIKLWTLSGKNFGTLFEQEDRAGCVCFSNRGRIFATTNQNVIRIWDLASLTQVRTLTGHTGRVSEVAFFADDKRLISGAGDGTVREWNLEDGSSRILSRDLEAVECVDVSQDMHYMAAGDHGGVVRVWNLEPGKPIVLDEKPQRVFSRVNHRDRVESIAFTHNGAQVVSVGQDAILSVSDCRAFDDVKRITVPGWRNTFTGFRLADDGTPCYWFKSDSTNPVESAAIRRDGSATALVISQRDVRIHLLDRKGRPMIPPLALDIPPQTPVSWIDFVPETPWLLLLTYKTGKDVRVYDLDQRRRLFEEFAPRADMLTMSRDGKKIAYECLKTITVADFPPRGHFVELQGHRNSVEALAFGPDGKILATGSADRSIRLWDTGTGELLHVLEGHRGSVTALDFSLDGKTLASGDADGVIKLWHLETAKPLFELPRAGENCRQLAFSADGSRLICRYNNDEVFEFIASTKSLVASETSAGTSANPLGIRPEPVETPRAVSLIQCGGHGP